MSRREFDLDVVALAVENLVGLLDFLQATNEDIDQKSVRSTAGMARDEAFKIQAQIDDFANPGAQS